ncbi:MAG: pilus assembly protein [Cognaticolwellia sp.]
MKKLLTTSLLLMASAMSYSEDIELYLSEKAKTAAKKTQVLIIFDDSGSMDTEETVTASYDPTFSYPALTGGHNFLDSHIYYSKGTGVPQPDSESTKRKFSTTLNGCDSSKSVLTSGGFYIGRVFHYKTNKKKWRSLPNNNGGNIALLDCQEDVLNDNAAGIQLGFPVNNFVTPYSVNLGDSNVDWASEENVTLYSGNYLRWKHQVGGEEVTKTRMAMAKESIKDVINSAPSIDFGLQVFNFNYGDDWDDGNGGRIVAGINKMTSANKTNLLNLVKNDIRAVGSTPLCESLYEASRYFSGLSVKYGNDDINVPSSPYFYTKNTPPRDTSIESGGKYKTPFSGCSDKVYVIIITDGEPQNDRDADSNIKSLSSVEDGITYNFNGAEYDNNYLAALAEWMHNRDINSTLDGKQTADVYTIGFSAGADDAAPLLKETAKLGGGKYFRATDSASLTTALVNTLEDLEPSNDSLTSASVAANNFDRTETLNSVYYAMFQPDNGPRWQGNLKKYKVVAGNQQGKHGKSALDENTGHFAEDVTSFWSDDNAKDGNVVAAGGVADMLRKKTNRVIYSDIGGGDALALLTQTQAETSFGGSSQLATEMGVAEADVEAYLNWAMGKNVDGEKSDDGTTPVMRSDVFGDPLHSKPLVVNYGDSIRVVIGTNAGALHMFQDNGATVDENWAFMPKEFFRNIKALRENLSTADKVYGVDGSITSYVKDNNGDGIINGTDKVWIFFGLRRGGDSYYALDISSPSTPSKLWKIDSSSTGFAELGQSWSRPKVGYSKLNVTGSGDTAVAAPVLFFGGGYDLAKDAKTPGTADSKGRAIYMVDAKTGTKKWSMTPSGGDTTFAGTDSIPSSIGILDSDGDGLTDRLYTGDTGGNVWRVDMPSDDPDDTDDPWTVFKLAALGGTANSTDLRFFNEPSIVRTFISETIETKDADDNKVYTHQEKPYDAVLIGSGDKSNPMGTDTNDTFFMIKDENITTQSFYSGVEPKIPAVVGKGDLYDYTDDPFSKVNTTLEKNTLATAVSKKSGWFIDFPASTGEKSTAEAIVINGVAFFTSFIPPNVAINENQCLTPNGSGLLYSVDLTLGTAVYNWKNNIVDADGDGIPDNDADGDGIADDAKRSTKISEQFLGAPTLIVVPDANGDTIGNIIVGREVVNAPFTLQTMRTYLYVGEEE